jgi:hypothetical protein
MRDRFLVNHGFPGRERVKRQLLGSPDRTMAISPSGSPQHEISHAAPARAAATRDLRPKRWAGTAGNLLHATRTLERR